MVVGVALVQVAEEIVEALLARQTALGGADVAQPPLADQRGPVAGLLQHAGHGDVAAAQRLGRRDSPGPALPRTRVWPWCWPVISTLREGAQTVAPA